MTSELFAAKTQKLFNRKRPLSGTQPPSLFQSFNKTLSSPAEIKTKGGETFTPNVRELALELPTKHVIRQSCTNSIGGINTKNPESAPRLFSVKPTTLAFGIIRLGCTYRYTFTIQNIGYESGRYRINPPNNPCIWCITKGNRIAPGMIQTLQLEFLAVQEGDINETIQIYTECEIYNIPITALVLNATEYEKYLNQRRRHNRPLYPENVKLYSAIPTSSRPDITNTEIKEIQDGVDEFHIPMDTIDNPDIDEEEREDILNMPSLPHIYWDRNEQKMTNDELELPQIQQQFALLEINKLQKDYHNVPPSGILLYKKLWTDQYDETKSSLFHPYTVNNNNNSTTINTTNLDETLYTTNTKKNTTSSSSLILNNNNNNNEMNQSLNQQQQQQLLKSSNTVPTTTVPVEEESDNDNNNEPIVPQPMKFPENEIFMKKKKEYNPSPLSRSNVIYNEDFNNKEENNKEKEKENELSNNNNNIKSRNTISRRSSSSSVSSKRSSINSLRAASEVLEPPPLQLRPTLSEPIINNKYNNNNNNNNNNRVSAPSPSPIMFNHKSINNNKPNNNNYYYVDREERRRNSVDRNINQNNNSIHSSHTNTSNNNNNNNNNLKVEDDVVDDELLVVDEEIKLSNNSNNKENKNSKEEIQQQEQQNLPPLAPTVQYPHLDSFVSDSVQEWSQELEHLTPREIEIKNCAPVIGKEDENVLLETDEKILQRMLRLLDK